MKIGASTYSLKKGLQDGSYDLLGMFNWLADNGGEHLEIVSQKDIIDFNQDPDLIDALIRRSQETDIDISCYTFGASFIDKTPDELELAINRVKLEIENAARLGVRLVRHDVASRPQGKNTDEQFRQDLPLIVDCCGEIADYAAQHGIITMIENHGLHVQGAARVIEVVESVARDNFQLLVDTGNFIAIEKDNTLQAIKDCSFYAAMVHIKDHHISHTPPPEGESGWRDRGDNFYTKVAIPCEGDIGLNEAIPYFRNIGFDSYFSLEFEGQEPAALANRRGMDNVRSAWETGEDLSF